MSGSVSSVEKRYVDRARAALKSVLLSRSHKVGERIFDRGSDPEYVFFQRSGVVQLERAGVDAPGLCVARAGDVIGVTYAISGRPYDMDARVTKAARFDVVRRDEFIRLMTELPGLHLDVVRMLSIDLGRCYEVLRTLGPKSRNRTVEEVTL